MDTNLILRDGTSNLTANATLTTVPIGPMTPGSWLWLHVYCAAIAETNDKLDVKLEMLDSSDVVQETINMKQISAVGVYSIPFCTMQPKLKVTLTITDADAGADYNAGGVKVWVDTANRYSNPS